MSSSASVDSSIVLHPVRFQTFLVRGRTATSFLSNAREPLQGSVCSPLSPAIPPYQLALISIIEHDTRLSLERVLQTNAIGEGGSGEKVDHAIGALFGEQSGSRVEITSSFEAKIDIDGDGRFVVDQAFLKDKLGLCAWGGVGGVGVVSRHVLSRFAPNPPPPPPPTPSNRRLPTTRNPWMVRHDRSHHTSPHLNSQILQCSQ